MSGKVHYLFVMLALFAGVRIHAQTATNVAGVFPNTNIVHSAGIGFAQGTCNDGTNVYVALTSAIQWHDTNYGPILGGFSPAHGITNGLTDFFPLVHLGDPDCYQGCIYVPMETAVGALKGAAIIDVAIFKTANMVRCAAVSISNYQSEASAVCIDPVLSNSVALFAANFESVSTNDGIYEYSVNNLTNLTFVKALSLTQTIQKIQGIICIGGMLYVLADNGHLGEVYQVNPTNGIVVYLAELNVPANTEWEGLDYLDGFLVANEGWTGTVYWFDFFGVQAASSTHRITGFVKDNHNNPIAGVGVTAATTINGTKQVIAVDTDNSGNYSLTLTNGNWSVAANCNGGSDSLGNLGNYSCPNLQSVSLVNNDANANFIVQNCNAFISTPSALPAGEAGVLYSQTLQATSCNPGYMWTMTGGFLPSGLSLSRNGTISGTPSGPGGVFNFTALVTDANYSTASQPFSIGISNALQIATTSLPDDTSCNMTLSASNGQPPYVWSLTPGSGLPPNMTLTPNGVLSGVSATSGTFNFSVRVQDNLTGIADQPLTVNLLQPLTIGASSGHISLLWPALATNYVLQSTTDLASSNWVTVSNITPGMTFIMSNPPPTVFFRLK